MDLTPNGIPFVSKSIVKCYTWSDFGSIQQDWEKISLWVCVCKNEKIIPSDGLLFREHWHAFYRALSLDALL